MLIYFFFVQKNQTFAASTAFTAFTAFTKFTAFTAFRKKYFSISYLYRTYRFGFKQIASVLSSYAESLIFETERKKIH